MRKATKTMTIDIPAPRRAKQKQVRPSQLLAKILPQESVETQQHNQIALRTRQGCASWLTGKHYTMFNLVLDVLLGLRIFFTPSWLGKGLKAAEQKR